MGDEGVGAGGRKEAGAIANSGRQSRRGTDSRGLLDEL